MESLGRIEISYARWVGEMTRIGVVFGTRPEIIKLAPVIRAMGDFASLDPVVISTGQHSSLREIAIREENLNSDIELSLMTERQSLSSFFARAVSSLDEIFEAQKLDAVLVQGDTATAFAGALAGYYRQLPVFHVEAGLRTGELYSPFPEEGNRKLVAQLASLHFAPTQEARDNLLDEGVNADSVILTGNTVVDSLKGILAGEFSDDTLSKFSNIAGHNTNLVWTFHRRENQGAVNDVVETLRSLALANPDLGIWVPVHPNPAVSKPIWALAGSYQNLHVLEPLNHKDFVYLLSKSDLVVTDSGGVQEEALSLGKRLLVLRNTTERPEVVSSGLGVLHDPADGEILEAVQQRLNLLETPTITSNPYGDGDASFKVCEAIEEYFR